MTKKIFQSIVIVAAAVTLACFVLIFGILFDYFSGVQKNQLQTELSLAYDAVQLGGMDYLEDLDAGECRLTWIMPDGTVIFDSKSDISEMENHGQREEIEEALASGMGEGIRYSSTRTEKTIYLAKKLPDGSVIRVSERRATVLTIFMGMLYPMIFVVIIALALSLLLANRLAKHIVKPLNSLDLENPLDNDVYDELSPLLTHIEKQHNQIDYQMKKLEKRRSEFYAVVENMNEGLVLLGREQQILSINPSATVFFETDRSCVGAPFVTIENSPEIQNALKTAETEGKSEIQTERGGRYYQLNASKIETDGRATGIVFLIFDISEKVFAERNRREFTANVSHELKTPLHSIMGSAELLENGLVREDDVPHFIGNIRGEATRLIHLVEDIIRLSRLDEECEVESESFELLAFVKSEVDTLSQIAKMKNVTVSVEGDETPIFGARPLYHEIVYNLIENAIKYNKDGGKVWVKVKDNENGVTLTVSDTGIGIPVEHQSRVFERFYRVDKSHSKETGGTGLGLSIVKHAVKYLGGEITLTGTPGEGTEVTVAFNGSVKYYNE